VTLTILPPVAAPDLRSWTSRRQQKKVPYTLIFMARSNVSVDRSATSSPEASTPALFIRMSTRPNAATASSNIRATWASSLMSACHRDRVTAVRLDRLADLPRAVRVVEIVDHDVGALLCELDCGGASDAGI